MNRLYYTENIDWLFKISFREDFLERIREEKQTLWYFLTDTSRACDDGDVCLS